MSFSIKQFATGIGLKPVSADPSNPTQGQLQYADGTVRAEGLWRYDGSAWQQVGSGAGSYDIFFQENLETNTASNFTTGQAASPDAVGTGTLGGTLANETSSQISGDRSLKYTMNATASSSNNDFIINDTDIALDAKQKGNFIGISFYYTYTGADDDIRFFVLDQDDNELTQSDEYIKANTNPTRFSTSVFIPSSDTAIRYGFQVVTGNSSKVFIVDDIEFSDNPFVYKNLSETQYMEYASTSALQNTSGEWRFATDLTSADLQGSNIIEIEDDSGNTRTKFVALKDCVVHVSFNGVASSAGALYVYKEGTLVARGTYQDFANGVNGVATSVRLAAGEFMSLGSQSTTSNNIVEISLVATAEAEHVVTPAKAAVEHFSCDAVETDFWDTTAATFNFNTSLVPLTDSQYIEYNDTTETRIVAKKSCIVHFTATGRQNDNVSLYARKGNGDYLSWQYAQANTEWNTISGTVELNVGEYFYFSRGTATSGSRHGGISLEVRPKEAEFLAAVPMNYTQTKILDADVSGTTDATNISFNNLVIGKRYRVTGQWYYQAASTTDGINFYSATGGGGTLYARITFDIASGTITSRDHVSFEFTAVSTTLVPRGNNSGSTIFGDGTTNGTFLTLTELNYTKETTRFT